MGSEQCIYSGSKLNSRMEAIGTCILVLRSGFILELEKTLEDQKPIKDYTY